MSTASKPMNFQNDINISIKGTKTTSINNDNNQNNINNSTSTKIPNSRNLIGVGSAGDNVAVFKYNWIADHWKIIQRESYAHLKHLVKSFNSIAYEFGEMILRNYLQGKYSELNRFKLKNQYAKYGMTKKN